MLSGNFNSENLTRIFAYWQEIRGPKPYALIGDIRPADIVPQLPFVSIFDVEGDPIRFRCRLEGTGVVTLMGNDITGQYFDDLGPAVTIGKVIEAFVAVAQTAEPRLHHEEYVGRNDVVMRVERLVLPATSDGTKLDRLFTCMARYEKSSDSNFIEWVANASFV